jgi:hypothetical protein
MSDARVSAYEVDGWTFEVVRDGLSLGLWTTLSDERRIEAASVPAMLYDNDSDGLQARLRQEAAALSSRGLRPWERPQQAPQAVPTPARPRVVPKPRHDWEWAIFNCPDIEKTTLAVACVVSRFSTYENGMDCRPQQKRVAAIIGLRSSRNVRDHLRTLTELGWLSQVAASSGPGEPNTYWLTIPDCHDHRDGWALPTVKD